MKSLLREYITKIIREGVEPTKDPQLIELLNGYVRSPRAMSASDRQILKNYVMNSTLPSGLTLERVSRSLPSGGVGDILTFDLASFTKTSLSTGDCAGHICWKSKDKCIFALRNPRRGLDVNYEFIKVQFDSFLEKEVIVTGNYVITSETMITEPGTRPSYGYKIPLYELQEA